MSTDVELLQLYAEHGSEPAFTALVDRHVATVYSAALRQVGGDPHRAHEVVQAVFTLLARKARSLCRHPALIGWLYTTTYYTGDKLRRAEQRRARLAQRVQAMSDDAAETTSDADWEQLRPHIDGFMMKLGERDRTAILLRFFANRSFRDIGEQLGLNENAARMRVDRALDTIQAALASRGITSTSTALAALLAGRAIGATPHGLAATISSGAISASAGSGAILLMSSFLIKSAVVVGVVVAGSAGLYHQHRLSAENTQLRSELSAARSLLADVRRSTSTPAATSIPEPVSAPSATLAGSAPPRVGVVPDVEKQLTRVNEMRNVGRATPAAAVQTILWAIEHGDESLPDMLFLNKATLRDAQELMTTLSPATKEKYDKPEKLAALYLSKQVLDYIETVQVQAVTQIDPETVEVTILTGEKGSTNVSMQWTPNGWLWKVKPSVIAAAKLDLLGSSGKGISKP